MSIPQVTNNGSETQTIDPTKHQRRLDTLAGYESDYTALINDPTYKSYFGINGPFADTKDALATAIENLKKALEGIYDEDEIDALMHALGTLLARLQGDIENRIASYEALLMLNKNSNKDITETDYAALLSRIKDTTEDYTVSLERFQALLVSAKKLAKYRGEGATTLDGCASISDKSIYQSLQAEMKNIWGFLDKTEEDLKTHAQNIINLAANVKDVWSSKTYSDNDSHKKTQIATLSMKVIQANNAYKGDLESQVTAEMNLEIMAQKNENLKRLRDEGSWQDSNTIRRQEILQEDMVQKAKEAEQKTKSGNI